MNQYARAYGARLKGQASVCKFTQKCTGCDASVDYTEAMIRDVLCRSRDGPRSTRSTGRENAIFDTLCEITSASSAKGATLDHHVFDQSCLVEG